MLREMWNPTFVLLAAAFAAAPCTAVIGFWRPSRVAPVAAITTAIAFAAALWGWAADAPRLDSAWAPTWGLRLTFQLDGLGVLYSLLATGIGLAVVIYSAGYLPLHLHHEHRPSKDAVRFFSFLLLFMGAMVGLVTARDSMLIFLFWDVTAIASFFLIGYDNQKPESHVAAMTAMLVTGGSAICLLIGVSILQHQYGTYSLDELIAVAETSRELTIAMILVAVAGLAKSAQVPFHFWLPRAMAAPTPVSAYLHSAAMVAAGVFLISRFSPLIALSDETLNLLLVIGFVSIAVGGILALTRDVLKQLLAYSTISQYGYVVVMLGLGGEKGAAGASFYVIAHALSKSALFLTAGAVTEATGQKALSDLGGLLRRMPALALGSAAAAAGLAALPLTVGFFKDELFFAAAHERGRVVSILAVLAATLTVGYMCRFWFGIFAGPLRSTPKRVSPFLIGPVVVLGVLVIAGGIWPDPIARLAGVAAEATINQPTHVHVAYHFDTRAENVMAIVSIAAGFTLAATGSLWRPAATFVARLGSRIGPQIWYDRALYGLNLLSDSAHRIEVRDLRSRVSTILLPAGILVGAGTLAERNFDELRVGSFDLADLPLTMMIVIAAVAAVTATLTANHLSMALVLSGVGYSLAVAYSLFGAPDVALVAVLIETLFTLLFFGMLTLMPDEIDHGFIQQPDPTPGPARQSNRRNRDRIIAVIAGGFAFIVTWGVLSRPTAFESVTVDQIALTPAAHGKDIVTVILADFRGLDTMGEITVIAIAFLGIATLLRRWRTS